MKLLTLLVFMLPITLFSQSVNDYEHAMAKFQKYYNEGLGDSLNAMFGYEPNEPKPPTSIWTNQINASALVEYGKLKSFKFIGVDKSDTYDVYVFITNFSKAGQQTTSLTLHKDKSLGTFRFITSSPGIDDLVKKYKSSH